MDVQAIVVFIHIFPFTSVYHTILYIHSHLLYYSIQCLHIIPFNDSLTSLRIAEDVKHCSLNPRTPQPQSHGILQPKH